MSRLSRTSLFENDLSSIINAFFISFNIGALLKIIGAYKTKGIPALAVFRQLFTLVFMHKSLFQALRSNETDNIAKDTFYRFLNSCNINWRRFVHLLAGKVIGGKLEHLTDLDRVNVFIVDDTLYERARSLKVELLSRLYDHCKHVYTRGFRLLTLGWSDGNSFIPVDTQPLASGDQKKRFYESRNVDKRTCGYQQRIMAQTKAPLVMLDMLRSAVAAGIHAKYVLFDSWFSAPATILKIVAEKLHVIAMVKKSAKVHYFYNGEKLSVKEIYRKNTKRRGRSRYLLSVEAEILGGDGITLPVRLVYVRKRGKRKEYLVLLSTDISLSEEEIIRIYGKRWQIEVFFKVCKSHLRLTKECHATSYDAMVAWNAIVMSRYMMLALDKRLEEDSRSFGELFFDVCDELPDITWTKAFELLLDTFLDVAAEKYFLADEEIESLLGTFMDTLPELLKKSLLRCA
ncbi:MAG: transposase [Synergistaceae bacterium]|nr:transposase [Synergistaceae bacterium]